jgi:tetratricopeptide (TPR) repeat protein
MDKSLPNDEQLLAYLDKNLSEYELIEMEKLIALNPAVQDKLDSLELAISSITISQTAKKVHAIHSEMMEDFSKPKVVSINRSYNWKKIFSVAASFLLIIVAAGFIWANSLSSGKVIAGYYVDYSVASSRSGQQELSAVKSYYIENNYAGIFSLTNATNLSAEDSLLIGISYFKTNDYQQSITWLNDFTKSKRDFREDAEYYLSMAYLKENNYERAIEILEGIKNDSSHLYNSYVTTALLFKVKVLKMLH